MGIIGESNQLYHYGVLGMRWGKRNSKSKIPTNRQIAKANKWQEKESKYSNYSKTHKKREELKAKLGPVGYARAKGYMDAKYSKQYQKEAEKYRKKVDDFFKKHEGLIVEFKTDSNGTPHSVIKKM